MGGSNPLIDAGARLIALANALRAETRYADIARLRQEVVDELRGFQSQCREAGAGEDEVRYGHYALCALLDEVILSTPWGAKSAWARQTLVATFHNEVVSGDRMFEIAESLEARPSRAPHLLELIYYCLSFGFEGRMRLDRQGASRLFQMRERIYAALRNLRGPFERSLSPSWRGEDAAYQALARQGPLWVYAAGFAVLALLIYAGFLLALSGAGAAAVRPLAAIYAAGPARLGRNAPPPPSDTRLFQTVLGILKPDIDAGRVAVTDQPDAVLVRLKDKGLFASGSADLDAAYDGTLQRVARAIGLTTGEVAVTGHTDDKPVRSLRFPSNQALSEARAQTVVDKLAADGAARDRLKPSGLGETQPVVPNTDDAARRQNRRVEVAIPKTYASDAGAARIM
ncbi:MAG: type VI secretion system protein TssL [Caulobacteraceae bacterium]|nr:type VI secretion system protein TssL [Caulobacter sp.]